MSHEESEDFQISSESINKRSGNYIFTVGDVSSGKSVLQNLLIYRLWTHEKIIYTYSSKDGNPKHDATLNDWVERFSNGNLPERTRAAILQEFNISFGQSEKRKLELNFVEMSGELINSIVPNKSGSKPKIAKDIESFLKQKNINKRFIFVSNGELYKRGNETKHGFKEDILFNSLLRYLTGKKGLGMTRLKVLFVAAKWDTVEQQYQNGAEEYFRRNFPQTRGLLKQSTSQVSYIPFSVGTVTDQKITSFESKHVDRMIQWIYNSYTGNTLKGFPRVTRTLLEKIGKIIRF